MSERPLALAIGQVGLEIACRVPSTADTSGPVEMDEISIQVCGSAAIAAASAAALGCRARLACKLAGDFLGHTARTALTGFGVELSCVVDQRGQLSPLRFGALSAPGRRAIFTTRGDVEPLCAADVDPDELLPDAGAALVDGTCPSAQIRVAEAAARRQVPVLFDGGHIGDGVGTLVGLSDVLICSERLASELAPRDDLEASLAEIQRLGPRAVIITLGEAGSIGLHGDQLVRQPSFQVDQVDPSGAGSVYHGAFAAALLAQLPFASCMAFASAAAALSCRRLGSFAGIPRREEVVSLLRARPPA
ncbi:MAG TPA: PfkB family carbohydrate kinase [Kofleriaceae bacterium]|nr:PfkB family carbohydrate kinase [Kofleriaceae bacterium]